MGRERGMFRRYLNEGGGGNMRGSDNELGGRAEGGQALQQARPGLELCPMIATITTSFVEHSLCVLPGVADKEVPFSIEGFILSPGETVGCSCQPSLRTASAEESWLAQDYAFLTAPGVKAQPPPPNLGLL